MPYCSNCGAKILDTDKFCNNCGATLRPVSAPAPINNIPPPPPAYSSNTPPPPPPSTYKPKAPVGETVITTISNFQKPKSFGRWDSFILLATQQNLMIIQLTNDMVNQSIKEAQEKAKAEGKGFFGQWSAQLGTSFDYAAQYAGWTKEQVLAKIPNTLIIPHSSVSQVDLKSEIMRGDYGNAVQRSIYKLKIQAGGAKYEYECHSLDTKIKAFHDFYPGRFKTNVYF